MDSEPKFVHLHLHTEFSLLDGGNRIRQLVEYVREQGMNSVAVTDHGNLFGAIAFYTAAKAAGIKPILGIEAYVAAGDRTERVQTGVADGGFHLVLLARNFIGWQNLLKLSSDSYANGFYYKPRMDRSTLTRWSEGLIAINGHLGSSLAHHLVNYAQTGDERAYAAAREEALWHRSVFGPDENGEPSFYIEVQRHSVDLQNRINPYLVKLARELSIPLVCDNDAHFMRPEDYDTHDTLICISMGKTKDETSRLTYSRELYVKSPEEMASLFSDLPDAVENTVRIAERCNVELDFNHNYAPVVKPILPADDVPYTGGDRTKWYTEFCSRYELEPFDSTRDVDLNPQELHDACDTALARLAEAGLIWRYGTDGITEDIRSRLQRELSILSDKGIAAYFLIVWDFVNWARQNGIPANARGSGVGTMVGYVLGLSNACPVRYGLLFERFTDPDRSEYPDIDIDICQDGRPKVIDYVRQKYGHVAQIITFGTLKARAAIKDVGRVMGFTPGETQRLANLVPDQLNITIDEALQKEPDLRSEYDSRPEVRQLFDTARRLEGQVRHAGVHAAGVVVATQPLDSIVPLSRPPGAGADSNDLVTQWDGPTVERIGLLKMDFLGLRTLSTLERCKQLVRESLSEEAIRKALNIDDAGRDPLDLDMLECNDPRVFELFQRGDTAGVFQFESGGMRRLLIEMRPDRLEDLIAANALYRPGPMDLIPEYNRRKHGQEPVPRVHPIVDMYTAETYGVMVYQEQVMQICHELGDIPLRQAYTLIKAISKKKQDVINAQRPVFVNGAIERGLKKNKAEELYDLILKFAGYGFNKSHSTGYAIIAYQTAYLKTYFPNQYMAAVLTFESAARKVSDWIPYLDDCRRTHFPDGHVGVEIRPPDLNLSDTDFSIVFDGKEVRSNNTGHVRFGLRALKGAGDKAIACIVGERQQSGPYTSIFDFCERVPSTVVNRATMEALIKAGALDSLHGKDQRAAMMAALDTAVRAGQTLAADRAAGQGTLFGGGDGETQAGAGSGRSDPPLPRISPWTEQQALAHEKETLGFFVSGHPLDRWDSYVAPYVTQRIRELVDCPDRTPVIVAGLVSSVRQRLVRAGQSAGQKMAMLTIEDRESMIDGLMFSDAYAQYGDLLQPGDVLLFAGEVDQSRGTTCLKVQQVIPVASAAEQLAAQLVITVVDHDDAEESQRTISQLTGLLKQHSRLGRVRGKPATIAIEVRTGDRTVVLECISLTVVVSNQLLADLTDLLGRNSYRIVGVPAHQMVTSGRGGGRWGNQPNSSQGNGQSGSRPAHAGVTVERHSKRSAEHAAMSTGLGK